MTTPAALALEKSAQLPAAGPVPSPCISVCRMDAASGLCEGCFRSLEEIATWGTLPDDARRRVWQQIRERALARSEP